MYKAWVSLQVGDFGAAVRAEVFLMGVVGVGEACSPSLLAQQ